MKNKKGIMVYAVALCAILLFICLVLEAIAMTYRCVYDRQTQEGKIQIYKTSELSNEILEKRNGKIVIEIVDGVVVDGNGNGVDSEGNYISYEAIGKVYPGTQVRSYLIYNPCTNYIDDIIERFDYILDGGS